MMGARGCVVTGITLLFLQSWSFGSLSQVNYSLSDVGEGRWEYTYEVHNLNMAEPIQQFTVYFDYQMTANLTITTSDPPASDWSEIVWQPQPQINDDGGYDALALGVGIGMGESEEGFSVSFDWIGSGMPGPQFYEIIDPGDFHTIESGYTVPEPMTISLFGFGMLIFSARKRKR